MTWEPDTAEPAPASLDDPARQRPAVHRAVIASAVILAPAIPVLLGLPRALTPVTLTALALFAVPASVPWLARRADERRRRAVTFALVAPFTWLVALYWAFLLFVVLAFTRSDYGGEDPRIGPRHEDTRMDAGMTYFVGLTAVGMFLHVIAPFAAAWSVGRRHPRLAAGWVGLVAVYVIGWLGMIFID